MTRKNQANPAERERVKRRGPSRPSVAGKGGGQEGEFRKGWGKEEVPLSKRESHALARQGGGGGGERQPSHCGNQRRLYMGGPLEKRGEVGGGGFSKKKKGVEGVRKG